MSEHQPSAADLNPLPGTPPQEFSRLTLSMQIAAYIQGAMLKTSDLINGELGHIPLQKGLDGLIDAVQNLREAETLLALYAALYQIELPPRNPEEMRALLNKWHESIKDYDKKIALQPKTLLPENNGATPVEV